MNQKMLSHRLRGYSEYEHSPSALKKACDAPVGYLEVDVRASSDGEFFLHHNPNTGEDFSADLGFSKTTSKVLKKIQFKNGEKLLTLEAALTIFLKRKHKAQRICLDIKDFGYEDKYLELVRRFKIENNVVFVSWIPQTLIRLSELGTTAPLILSHWNSLKFGLIGRLFSSLLSNTIFTLSKYVFLGKNKYHTDLIGRSLGYQYAILLHEIPAVLLRILSVNGGGICVHKSLACPRLNRYCRQNHLALWIFSVSGSKEFYRYANEFHADVIFCDDVFA